MNFRIERKNRNNNGRHNQSLNEKKSLHKKPLGLSVMALLVLSTISAVMLYSPNAAFAAISINSSSNTFFGPSLVRVLITDTALTSSSDTIVPHIDVKRGSSILATSDFTITAIGTSGAFEFFLTTSNDPSEPSNPTFVGSPSSNANAFVVRINTAPILDASNDYAIFTPGALQDGDSIVVTYGGSSNTIAFARSAAAISLDRTVAAEGDNIFVRVNDQDANIDPTAPDSFDANALLNSTIHSLTFASPAKFRETGQNSGVFEFAVNVSNTASAPTNGGVLSGITYPSSETFVFQDKDVYQAVSGSTSPYDVIAPSVSSNTPSASVTLQISSASLSLPVNISLANGIQIQVNDVNGNVDTTVRDVIPASALEIRVAGVSGVEAGYPLRETDFNTGIFLPDTSGNRIPINVGTSDFITTAAITLSPATIANDPLISIRYDDGNGHIVSITTNLLHFVGTISSDQAALYPTGTFHLTISDNDLNTDSHVINSYTVVWSPGTDITSGTPIASGLGSISAVLNGGAQIVMAGGLSLTMTFIETGPNTGIFTASSVDLSKINNSIPGGLKGNDQVGFIYSDNTEFPQSTSSATMTILPQVSFDRATYLPDGIGTITVVDALQNTDTNAIDLVVVRVFSDSDAVGQMISLLETGPNTGIFTSAFTLSSTNTPGAVLVKLGDTLQASYPNARNAQASVVGSISIATDKATYSKGETVMVSGNVGSALVDSTYSVNVTSVALEDISGNVVEFQLGVQSIIAFNVVNLSPDNQPFAATAQVRKSDGTIELLSFQTSILPASGSSQVGLSWTPEANDNYSIRILIFRDIPSLQPIFQGATYDVQNKALTFDDISSSPPHSQGVLRVFNPSAVTFRFEQVKVSADGSFTDSFPLAGPLATVGDYSLLAAYGGNTATPISFAESAPTISLGVSDISPPWGESVTTLINVTGASAGDYVDLLHFGNGSTFTSLPAFTTDFTGQLNPVLFSYDSSQVGQIYGVNATLRDGSTGIVKAFTNTIFITPQKRPTYLLFSLPNNVITDTTFTGSGTLYDSISNAEIENKAIAFTGAGGISLGSTTTQGVHITDPSGLSLHFCPAGQCAPNNIGAFSPDGVNALQVHAGTIFSVPSTATFLALTIQDTDATSVDISGVRSDASTFTKHFVFAQTPATLYIKSTDVTHPTTGLESVTITSTDSSNGLVGITRIELSNEGADPALLFSRDFDNLSAAEVDGDSTIIVGGGAYSSTGIAPVVADTYQLQANFAGDAEYLAATDVNIPELSISVSLPTSVQLPDAATGFPGDTVQITGDSGAGFVSLGCTVDTDGDGICDDWETNGIPYVAPGGTTQRYTLPSTSDPAIVGSAAVGPSSTHYDIYLEIDSMAGHAPNNAALHDVIQAFANAPIQNPDGTMGITLHILKDELNLTHQRVLNVWTDSDQLANNDFDSIKAAHFGNSALRTNPAMRDVARQVWHYALYVHSIGDCGPAGLAEIKGNDIIVAMGCGFSGAEAGYTSPYQNGQIFVDTNGDSTPDSYFKDGTIGTENEQAGTLMHELGHNLNLKHGGPAEIITKITGTQLNGNVVSSSGSLFGPFYRSIPLSGFSFSAGGAGSGAITLKQKVEFQSLVALSSTEAPSVSASSDMNQIFGSPSVTVLPATSSTSKTITITLPYTISSTTQISGVAYASLGTLTTKIPLYTNVAVKAGGVTNGNYPTSTRIIPSDSDINCKPNYEGVMSYGRQLPNYLGGGFRLDYSRGAFGQLTETGLNEVIGLKNNLGNDKAPSIVYGIPAASGGRSVKTASTYAEGQTPIGIDWNIIGGLTVTTHSDINYLGIRDCNTASESSLPFNDYNDWNNLVLAWQGNVGTAFDGVHAVPAKASDELTPEIYAAQKQQVPTVSIESINNIFPRWGIDEVVIAGTTTLATAEDTVLIDWGDGSPTEIVHVDSTTGAFPATGESLSHLYGVSSIGERSISTTLLDDSSNVKATSAPTNVFVQPHAVTITLDPIAEVDPGASVTITGGVVDNDMGGLSLANANPISIIIAGGSVLPVSTDSTGHFSLIGTAPTTPGTYQVEAEFTNEAYITTQISTQSLMVRGTGSSNNENILLADAGVINLGQTTKLTQHLDVYNGLTGTMQELKVTEPDGDVCVATGLPDAIRTPSGELTKTYPTDFTIDTANSNGDGVCNTESVGIYAAESKVNVNGVVKTTSAEFETNFFVLPESPIGSLLLVGMALTALGGYYSYSKMVHRKRFAA
jgi:hypothetical protein